MNYLNVYTKLIWFSINVAVPCQILVCWFKQLCRDSWWPSDCRCCECKIPSEADTWLLIPHICFCLFHLFRQTNQSCKFAADAQCFSAHRDINTGSKPKLNWATGLGLKLVHLCNHYKRWKWLFFQDVRFCNTTQPSMGHTERKNNWRVLHFFIWIYELFFMKLCKSGANFSPLGQIVMSWNVGPPLKTSVLTSTWVSSYSGIMHGSAIIFLFPFELPKQISWS